MARTLYLPDGSTEIIFNDPEETLGKVIYERLGRDCEELYKELLNEARHPLDGEEGDDFEHIADGYLTLLQDTMQELRAVMDMFSASRLDRQKVYRGLKTIHDNISKNL